MSAENAAGSILQRGVSLDNQKRYTEALICYQEGLQILVDKIKEEADTAKKLYLRTKIEEYMKRAEHIKKLISEQKDSGIFHEQIHIDNDSTGYSYKTLFGRFFDSDVTCVRIEDPYIRSFHQCQNLLRFCELLVQGCDNLHKIILITSRENDSPGNEQGKWFDLLATDLKKYKIILNVEFSPTLHDRQIFLSTGWIFKVGRGLDFYKPPANKFTLGMYDLDLRPCHQTVVDIFHTKDVKHKFS